MNGQRAKDESTSTIKRRFKRTAIGTESRRVSASLLQGQRERALHRNTLRQLHQSLLRFEQLALQHCALSWPDLTSAAFLLHKAMEAGLELRSRALCRVTKILRSSA